MFSSIHLLLRDVAASLAAKRCSVLPISSLAAVNTVDLNGCFLHKISTAGRMQLEQKVNLELVELWMDT